MGRTWPFYAVLVGTSTSTLVLVSMVLSQAYQLRRDAMPRDQVDAQMDALRARVAGRFDKLERPPLEELYATLEDRSRIREWSSAIRMIAGYGTSEESSAKLVQFIRRDEPGFNHENALNHAIELKLSAITALSFTGGDRERELLLRIFRDDRRDDIAAAWMPRLFALYPRMIAGTDLTWRNELRGAAALGLILADDDQSKSEVRELFEKLRQAEDTGLLSSQESHLLRILEYKLSIARAAETFGSEVLLIDDRLAHDLANMLSNIDESRGY